jgi:hypothetical protein
VRKGKQLAHDAATQCPGWVKLRPRPARAECRFYPRKQTSIATLGMSVRCQYATLTVQAFTKKGRPEAAFKIQIATLLRLRVGPWGFVGDRP